MTRYRNAHLWLTIPFVLIMLGFLPSYWLAFTEAAWRHHLHGLSATAWFILLIVQPYLVTRGRNETHRRFGLFALVLAGAVVASGLGAMPYNLTNENLPPEARYGLTFIDVVVVAGFTFAVVMAIRTPRKMEDHARWMISTAFWAVSPGLFRLYFVPLFVFGVPDPGGKAPYVLAAAGVSVTLVLTIMMLRERRAHLAYVLPAVGSLVYVIALQVGAMAWWQRLADALFSI